MSLCIRQGFLFFLCKCRVSDFLGDCEPIAPLGYFSGAVEDSGRTEEFGQYAVILEFIRCLNPADATC